MIPGLIEKNYELWHKDGNPTQVCFFMNAELIEEFPIEKFEPDFQEKAKVFAEIHKGKHPNCISFSRTKEGEFFVTESIADKYE